MIDARALARASGAAQRAYGPVTALVAITAAIGGTVALQGTAVIEELDLLRFYLREETLRSVIEPARSASAAPPADRGSMGGQARAAKLSPRRRKAIAKAAARARWGKQ